MQTRTDQIEGLGKLPPQAIDLEEVVLGAILLQKDAITSVIDILRPEIFYKDAHATIYEAALKLFSRSEPIDLKTISNQLKKDGKLEFAGGAFYLVSLTQKVTSSENIVHHSRILYERMIRRELIRICQNGVKQGYDDTIDGFDLLGTIEQSLLDISGGNMGKQFSDSRKLLREALNSLEERCKNKTNIIGIPSGINAIDKVTSGWQDSDLIIIAARPGVGKTAMVLTALRNASVDHGKPVAMFSLEMSESQLTDRLISSEAEIDSDKIKKGNLADYEWESLIHKTAKLHEAPFFIDDTPGLSILELRAKARRLKMKHDIKLIIVDYIQLMTGEKGNRDQEISSISRGLKLVAKELNVPVIALSQLSRAVETRGGNKIPQLSDLRESGSIEQDADMVCFLYRPEYYDITELEDGSSSKNYAEFIVAKFRNGSLGAIPIKFIGKYTKFTDLEYSHFEKTGLPEPKFIMPNSSADWDLPYQEPKF